MADEIRAIDPTIRERMSSGVQRGLEGFGVDRYKARKHAQTLMGGESSNLPGGIGIADFVPFLGTTMAAEEGVHDLADAYGAVKRGDVVGAIANTAGAAANLIPGAPGTIKAGKAAIKKIKAMELPKLKPIGTDSVPKKQSLQEWAMAGGGVPVSHKDRADVWHKKVQRFAAGGEVYNTVPDMADGGELIDGPAYAKGGVVKKVVKEAVEGVVEGVKPMVDRLSMSFKDVTKRVPELTEGAQRLGRGELSAAEFDKLVNQYKPVKPYDFVPRPATVDEAMEALTEAKRGQYGKTSEIPAGERTELRLDIPAYTSRGVWVNSIHRPQTKQPTAYGSTSSARNVDMIIPEEKALNVAQGGAKAPFAVMRGEWNPMSEAEAVARSREFLSHPDWAQIGMDPERHSYFYDRRTMQPVRSAEEVIQIGPLVLAKKPKYGKKEDYKYAEGGDVEMAKGGGVKKLVQEIAEAGSNAIRKLTGAPPKGVEPIPVRTPEEQSVIDKFGQKQEQEAARAKKVEKLAQQEPTAPAKPAKAKGPRAKVEPDIYRKMAAEQGDEAVLRAARAGEHLKPTPGGYVGAPRTVTSGQSLGAMRRAMDKDFADSVEAVRLADPERLGTWYDRAKQGIAESSEPYQLPRTLEQHGVYSAGVSPESELGFALKHLNSRVAGQPEMAYRGAPMRNLDSAVAEDRPANMGFKIGEYANKNDPRIPNEGLFGVNDFRRAQGMGYTDPQGNPWKAGVSETMHPFMDAETALQVDRANKAGMGGRTDWAGPHIQEVPWVYGKAQDLYSRGKAGRFGGDELEGIKGALQEANNTARDYMYKHAASATHEAIPGASLGHVRQALDMTPAEKLEYGRTGRWDMPPPEYALSDMPQVGAGNRDIIYGAAGYRQLPSREAEGLYVNRLGGVETNPMTIARPLMDFPTGGGGLMAPSSRKMADTLEQFRAFLDAQEAGAYNLPNTMASVKGKNSLVLDSRSRNPNKLDDPSAGVTPTAEQLAAMNRVMEDTGFGVTATNRGVAVFPFDPAMDPKEAGKILRKKQKELTAIYPSTPEKSLTTTGYVPGIGKRSPEGPLSTAPYSGEATGDLLQAFAELPPSVAMNISESEAIREAIRQKALRDSKMGGTRGDIQESRRFFSEADWPKAVEMIRKGMSVPAALAALGYSASSMAGERQ